MIIENKALEITDNIYRLEEMIDAMHASIENAKTVCTEQEHLIEVVEAANDEMFADFIEKSKEQIEEFKRQIVVLTRRKLLLENLIEKSKSDDDTKMTINTILDALGVFSER